MDLKCVKDMSKINNLRKYFIFFFIFAQDSNIPLGKVPSKLLACIPTIVSICLLTWFVQTLIEQPPKSPHLSDAGNNVLITITIIYIIPVVFVLYENWTHQNRIPHILNELLITKRYIENKMRIPFNQTKFERVFSWKVAATLLSISASFTTRMLIRTSLIPHLEEFSTFAVIFIKSVAVTHIVFYMDLVKSVFNSVNLHFDAMAENKTAVKFLHPVLPSKTIISNYYDLKFVHFKMMRVISGLNSRFNWTLLSLSFDAFLSLTYYICWMFLYHITSPENGLLIIRNYLISFISIYFDYLLFGKYLF